MALLPFMDAHLDGLHPTFMFLLPGRIGFVYLHGAFSNIELHSSPIPRATLLFILVLFHSSPVCTGGSERASLRTLRKFL